MRLVAFGLIAGITITLLLGRLLRGLLYDVASNDPRTLLGVGVLLAGVALLACWWPARRASTVDPVVALRTE
jgi:ABC-type lipoprotein release transport system permease subunit